VRPYPGSAKPGSSRRVIGDSLTEARLIAAFVAALGWFVLGLAAIGIY
jgi:hypothetical protein